MTEEQLAIRVGADDELAFAKLARSMERLVASIVAKFYAPGLDRDDLTQAALVGLWHGCRNYNRAASPNGDFTAFAVMCMRRAVITAVVNDEEAGTLHDLIPSRCLSPVEEIAQREEIRALVAAVQSDLTPLERESLIGLAFLGESMLETEARIVEFDGDRPGRARYSPAKTVDNALSRARWKLRRALNGDADRLPLGVAA